MAESIYIYTHTHTYIYIYTTWNDQITSGIIPCTNYHKAWCSYANSIDVLQQDLFHQLSFDSHVTDPLRISYYLDKRIRSASRVPAVYEKRHAFGMLLLARRKSNDDMVFHLIIYLHLYFIASYGGLVLM